MGFGAGAGGDGGRSVPGSACENGSVNDIGCGRENVFESACDEIGCAPVCGISCCVSVLGLGLARGLLCRVGVLFHGPGRGRAHVLGPYREASRGLTLWWIAVDDGRDSVL